MRVGSEILKGGCKDKDNGCGGWEVCGSYGMKQGRGRRNRRASIIFHHHQGEGISGGEGSRRYYGVWGMGGLGCYTCLSCFFFLFPASSPYPPQYPPGTLPHAHPDGGSGRLHKLVCFFSASSLHHRTSPQNTHTPSSSWWWWITHDGVFFCASCLLYQTTPRLPPPPVHTLLPTPWWWWGDYTCSCVLFFLLSVSSDHQPPDYPPLRTPPHPHPDGDGLHMLVRFFLPLLCII